MNKMNLTMILTLIIGFLGNLTMANEKVVYWAQVGIEGMYCRVDVNGISIFDSKSKGKISESTGFGFEIGEFLIEGENEIGVTAWATNERVEDYIPTCQIKVSAIVKKPTTGENELKEVTMLYVSEDEKGDFTAKESTQYELPNLTDRPIKEVLNTQYQSGINQHDIRFSRLLKVNHPLPFRWKDAEVFKDTPENRAKLWAKYDELRDIMQKKDINAWLKSFKKMAIEDRAKYEEASIEMVENYHKKDVLKAFSYDKFQVLPFNSNDFELNIIAKGKLVQFVSKDGKYTSPVQVKVGPKDNDKVNVNSLFSIINGELVPVIW